MLRTVQSLPPTGLVTLGFDPARFQTEPPACYRAPWRLPGPDSHRLATASLSLDSVRITSNCLGAPPRCGGSSATVRDQRLGVYAGMSWAGATSFGAWVSRAMEPSER
jgi:hypothetical protein